MGQPPRAAGIPAFRTRASGQLLGPPDPGRRSWVELEPANRTPGRSALDLTPSGVQALDELRAKSSAVLPAPDWHVHYALFSRSGFTEQLTAQASSENVWLVGLEDVVASQS